MTHGDAIADDDPSDMPLLLAELHHHAGHTDEALQHLRTYLDQHPRDIDALTQFVMEAIAMGQSAAALAALDQADTEIEARHWGRVQKEDRGLLHRLRAWALLRAREYDAALAAFETACRLFPPLRESMHQLYQQLLLDGEYQRALRLIETYRGDSLAVRFWHGVALHHLGNSAQARTHWQQLAATDPDDLSDEELPFWILSHYYLGDAERAGLAAALGALLDLDETDDERWLLYTLAAIGSAMRGDTVAAEANFETARNIYAFVPGQGKRLPADFALFLTDVLPPEESARYLGYFSPLPGAEAARDTPNQERS
jgi:tetratricopeptide (TPR) repeat protein